MRSLIKEGCPLKLSRAGWLGWIQELRSPCLRLQVTSVLLKNGKASRSRASKKLLIEWGLLILQACANVPTSCRSPLTKRISIA